jgi:hypothetical protein
MDWQEIETSTHQDHVIAHVVDATVVGWFVANEAAHLLLDIGFLWTIYLDGEMNLLPHGVAIGDLDTDEITDVDKTELAFDAQLLLSEGAEASGLKRFTGAGVECQIKSVAFSAKGDVARLLVIQGETARITVETSLEDGAIRIDAGESGAVATAS